MLAGMATTRTISPEPHSRAEARADEAPAASAEHRTRGLQHAAGLARQRVAEAWDDYVNAYTLACEAERASGSPPRGALDHENLLAHIAVQAKRLGRTG